MSTIASNNDQGFQCCAAGIIKKYAVNLFYRQKQVPQIDVQLQSRIQDWLLHSERLDRHSLSPAAVSFCTQVLDPELTSAEAVSVTATNNLTSKETQERPSFFRRGLSMLHFKRRPPDSANRALCSVDFINNQHTARPHGHGSTFDYAYVGNEVVTRQLFFTEVPSALNSNDADARIATDPDQYSAACAAVSHAAMPPFPVPPRVWQQCSTAPAVRLSLPAQTAIWTLCTIRGGRC